ncbi:MAG: hypothetical protein IJB49_07505 [Clostridia bacterium]|nr:hypothetical protein [Clostridia bacterium]
MKRIFAVLLAAVMLAAIAVIPASAAATFTVDITNTSSEIYTGDTIEVFFEVDDLAGDAPLALIEFEVTFDPTLLQANYNQTNPSDASRFVTTPGNAEWEHVIKSTEIANGYYKVSLMPEDMGYDWDNSCAADSCLNVGESVKISLTFNVIGAVGQEASVTVSNVTGRDGNDSELATKFNGTGDVYTATISDPKKPVTTLGAKINVETPALRLGAKYERAYLEDMAVENVVDLGIVFYPTRFLDGAELTLETEGALTDSASGIVGWDSSKEFVDYESFEFYVTIVNIPYNGMDDEISFRAFVMDDTNVIYADDTISRSYEYVYNVNFPSLGTGEGDTVIYPGTGWFN